jgi:DNA-binding NarL/FixJ family response regulator
MCRPAACGEKSVGAALPAKVLIVDDHKLTRSVVRSLLDEHFIRVCGEAENGKQAIEKVRRLRPDLVLLDINMPVMNGIQAAYEIRKIAPSIKIVFFTVHDGPEQKAAARLLGIHEFVAKSAAGTHLVPAVKRLIMSD